MYQNQKANKLSSEGESYGFFLLYMCTASYRCTAPLSAINPRTQAIQFVGDSRTLADSFILLLAPYVAQTRENGGDFAPRPLRVLRRRRHFSLKKSVSKEYSPQLHSSETTPRPSFITFTLMQK